MFHNQIMSKNIGADCCVKKKKTTDGFYEQ